MKVTIFATLATYAAAFTGPATKPTVSIMLKVLNVELMNVTNGLMITKWLLNDQWMYSSPATRHWI